MIATGPYSRAPYIARTQTVASADRSKPQRAAVIDIRIIRL
jgi:hypothetical protein